MCVCVCVCLSACVYFLRDVAIAKCPPAVKVTENHSWLDSHALSFISGGERARERGRGWKIRVGGKIIFLVYIHNNVCSRM